MAGSDEVKEKYVSKSGFVEVPVRRGFDEMLPLWTILEEVKSETGKDCFVCGGYARWCASPKVKPVEATDIDVYCEDEAVFEILKNKIGRTSLEVRHDNPISLTYRKPDAGIFADMLPLQLIKPVLDGAIVAMGDKASILNAFDFTVIRAAIVSSNTVLADADFLHDEEKGLIRIKNIHCPISSTLRCMKYSRKGYFLTPFQCLGLFLDWDSRDDDYRLKLKEFLEKASENEGLTQEEVDEL